MIDTEASIKFYLQRLDFLKNDFANTLNNCSKLLFINSDSELSTTLNEITRKLQSLENDTKPQVPNWVIEFKKNVQNFRMDTKSSRNREAFYKTINLYLPTIKNYNWTKAGVDVDFDFEEIYKKYKRDSKIDELFNEVTDILEKILQDDNSKDKREKINILISIIKNNQNKSCYADDGIINSIYNFLIEIGCLLTGFTSLAPLIIQLKDILKELISAYKTTKENTENEIRERTQMNFTNSVYLEDGSMKLLEEQIGTSVNINA